MKIRRTAGAVLAAALIASQLCGCASAKDSGAGTAEQTENGTRTAVESTDAKGDVPGEEQTEAETVEETKETAEETTEEVTEEAGPRVSVSSQGYEKLAAAGKYYIFVENGRCGVVDAQGEIIIPCEYEYYVSGKEVFALGNGTEAGYDFALFDADAREIFRNTDYPEYYISNYNEGMLRLIKTAQVELDEYGEMYGFLSQAAEYVYLDAEDNFSLVYDSEASDKYEDLQIDTDINGHVYARIFDWLSPYSHGYITTRRIYYNAAELSSQARIGDTEGNFSWLLKEISSTNYDGMDLTAINGGFAENSGNAEICFDTDGAIGTDGWVLGYFKDWTWDEGGRVIAYWGLYNIDTKQAAVIHPADVSAGELLADSISLETMSFSWRWADSNLRTATVNDMMLLDFESDDTYLIWNVAQDRYMTDVQYGYVDLAAYGENPVLVSSEDGRWGYLDEDFREMEWFDDASNFSGGYALVVKDGGVYVIDRELNIVSDMLEGTGVGSLNDKGGFRIQKADGSYYICTVEE